MIHVVMDKIAKDARMPEVEADAKKAKTEDAPQPPSQATTEEEK
jgi:N utilization substance protein B